MKMLVLGNIPSPLRRIIEDNGDGVMEWSDPLDVRLLKDRGIEFIVSYGYRHLIRKDVLEYLPGRVINLHISYLPWNRGADPNLWSFLEETPKGVSIHFIDRGIDTGDVIAQREMRFEGDGETLATTYKALNDEIVSLFQETWTSIRGGRCRGSKQPPGGSFHKSSDREKYVHLLTEEWNTPVGLLRGKALPPVGIGGAGQ